jgi:outer membrane receptor protein involved in Fe transport
MALCLWGAGGLAAEEPMWLASAEGAGDGAVFLSLTRSAEPLARTPTNVTVVTREEIDRFGAKTLDEALNRVPSLNFTRTGTLGAQSTVRLRGVPTSNDVQIVIDDQPLGGVSAQNVDLAQITTDDIERIEIVRGGGSVLYGANTLGGVIHVITKRPTEDGTTSLIRVEGRTFRTRVTQAEISTRRGGFFGRLNGGRFMTDGFQDNAEADQITASGVAGWTFSGGGELSLNLARVDHDAELPGGTPVDLGRWDGRREREASTPLDWMKQKTTRARVKAVIPLGVGAVLENTAYASASAYRSDIADVGAVTSYAERIRGDDLRLRLPSGLTVGGGYEWDGRRSDITDWMGNPELPSHVANWNLYTQQNWVAGPVTLIPALRLDQHTTFGSFYSPRLTLVVRPSDRWKVSANAGRSFRAPTFLDLFYPGLSNPNLKPETAWSYDLGLERRIGPSSRVAATGFYSRITDRIAADPDDGYRPNNRPRAELSGAEIEADQTWGTLEVRTNYTYQRAVGGSMASSRYVPLRLSPRHLANQEILWHASRGWTWSNTLRYVHRQFSTDGEKGAKLPSFTLWGLRVTKRILAADLFFAVDNLTDKHYTESFGFHGYVPQPGRTYAAGLTIRFDD